MFGYHEDPTKGLQSIVTGGLTTTPAGHHLTTRAQVASHGQDLWRPPDHGLRASGLAPRWGMYPPPWSF